MASNYGYSKQLSSTIKLTKDNSATNAFVSNLVHFKLLSQDGPQVHGHISCVISNVMYVHGGLVNKNDRLPSNKLFKFDFQNGWKDITPINSPYLSHHCALVQGEYIILIGGWNGVNRSSEVFVYNTVNEQMNMAVSRGFPNGAGLSNHTCNFLKDGRIIIFGREGSLKTQRRYGNSFLLEGSSTSLKYTYTDAQDTTASRSGHNTIEMDKNHLLIIGGRKDKVFELHSCSLNASENINSSLGSLIDASIESNNSNVCKLLKKEPQGRRFAVCIKLTKTTCLLHGGETFDSHFRNPVDDILILHMPTFKWYSLGETGVHLQAHTICNLEGRFIVHGGLTSGNHVSNMTYELSTS